MAVMKQMQECLDKAFNKNMPPHSQKWKGFLGDVLGQPSHLLFLYHYHHLVLVYNTKTHEFLHEWWEKPTDKRGLDSAKEYLEEWWRKQNNIQG